MKIAIDVRKWRDFGVGTYVRNLVRHLARLDHETTYFLFCHDSDEATLRDLAENFVPVVESSAGYGVRTHTYNYRRGVVQTTARRFDPLLP